MKHLAIITSTLILFTACQKIDGANPSQNEALNSVAGKKEKTRSGYMQQALDKWLAEEWSPAVSGTETPTGDTKIKILPNEDGSGKLVEVETGAVLKELTIEEVKKQKEVEKTYQKKVELVPNEDGSAKLVELNTGVVLKEMTKEQVKKRKEVQEKYKEEDRNFTLQEYVDKMSVYSSTHVSNAKDSHTMKIKSMPVIGSKKR